MTFDWAGMPSPYSAMNQSFVYLGKATMPLPFHTDFWRDWNHVDLYLTKAWSLLSWWTKKMCYLCFLMSTLVRYVAGQDRLSCGLVPRVSKCYQAFISFNVGLLKGAKNRFYPTRKIYQNQNKKNSLINHKCKSYWKSWIFEGHFI